MKIFSNLATSLDGKIATAAREFFLLGTSADHKQMQVLRKRADAVLMGAGTLRTFRRPVRVRGASKQPMNVIVSSSLEGVSPDWPFFEDASIQRVLFVSKLPPAARLKRFERSSQVLLIGDTRRPASAMVRALKKLGVKRLLVEGGGGVMWDFARENLIDEYNVTLTPRILGGTEAPTLVDGAGFKPSEVLNLKLKSLRKIGNEIFLVYGKTARRG